MISYNRIVKRIPNFIIAFAVFLGGLINIVSVAMPPVIKRLHIVLQLLPLNFVRAAHFIMLVFGLVLLVVSVNIYRGKRRAYVIAVILSFASIILHLTKAIDYEEAIASFILLSLLIVARRRFTVKSVELPLVLETFSKVAMVLFATFLYGVLGFWFLDTKEFHINFTLRESVAQTLKQIAFISNGITPYTHHAKWFLSSLRWLTIIVILYSSTILFRPVLLIFKKDESIRMRARRIIEQYGNSSIDYFKYWPDKTFFFSRSGEAVISYKVYKKIALVLGDPVGAAGSIKELLQSFIKHCHENDWHIALYQASSNLLSLYNELGLKYIKVGDEAIVDLSQFSLGGKNKKEFRTTINKFRRNNFTTEFLQAPLSKEIVGKLETVSKSWLMLQGRRERTFTLGQFRRDYVSQTPVFLVLDDKKDITAFVNLLPVYNKSEITIDLMRFLSNAPNGTMDYLFVELLQELKKQGLKRFSLGLVPMSGFQPKEIPNSIERTINTLFQSLNFLFRFKGIKAYKAKFANIWEPRYLVYEHVADFPDIVFSLSALSEISKHNKKL